MVNGNHNCVSSEKGKRVNEKRVRIRFRLHVNIIWVNGFRRKTKMRRPASRKSSSSSDSSPVKSSGLSFCVFSGRITVRSLSLLSVLAGQRRFPNFFSRLSDLLELYDMIVFTTKSYRLV
ncbi:hypothetical protein L1987_17020 [Smallanthus sonchifolius]|uniref:Uncharacterized protein n=1 Tax=Smallanthus sonchifolius TaxID=185202 RepID=A0ACB9IXV6_9ASTR|nr:hypothetical protein L1987_17020 [Smallanthus sonchifolius]